MNEKERHLPPSPLPPLPSSPSGAGKKFWPVVLLLLLWMASLYSEPARDRAALSHYERRLRDAPSGLSLRMHLTPSGSWVWPVGASSASHFVWPEALWAEAAPAAHRLLQRKLLERTLFYLAPEELTPERVLRLHDFVGQLRGRGVLLYLEPPRLPHWAQGTTAAEGLAYEAYGWLRPGGEREVEDFFAQLRQTPSLPSSGTGAPRTAAEEGLAFEEVEGWERQSAFKKFATPTAPGAGADADAGDPGRLLEGREDWRAVIQATVIQARVRNTSPTETVWMLDGSASSPSSPSTYPLPSLIWVPSERRGADGGWQALPAAGGWRLWPPAFAPMPVPTPLPPGKGLSLWAENLEARVGDEVRLELWISRVEPPPGIDWQRLPLWDPLWRLFHPVKGPAWRVR